MNKYSLISARQYSRGLLEELIHLAEEVGNKIFVPNRYAENLRGFRVGLFFDEGSTRTRLGFDSAIQSLGGIALDLGEIERTSIFHKGETYLDTARTLVQKGANVVVARLGNTENNKLEEIAEDLEVPVINAGNRNVEHPTQAAGDIYTIQKTRGSVDGVKIATFGDHKNGRTIRSLGHALVLFDGVEMNLIPVSGLEMEEGTIGEWKEKNVKIKDLQSLKEIYGGTMDFVYLTRLQKDRYKDQPPEITEMLSLSYPRIDDEEMEKIRPKCGFLHPLPKTPEGIDPKVDKRKDVLWWEQEKCCLYMNAAILLHTIAKAYNREDVLKIKWP